MALAFVSSTISAATAVATAVPVPYPASIVLGDVLVLLVGTKQYDSVIATPAGWTPLGEITNGTTATGVDTGSVKAAAFGREAAGGETGNLTVSISGAAVSSSWGSICRYTKAANMSAQFVLATGTDTTIGGAWSVAFSSNPGLTGGDEVALAGVISTDIATNTWTAPGLTATGATITTPTVRQSAFISTGNDSGGTVMTAPVTAGPSSGNPTWTATCGQGTNNTGSAVLVRIREVPKPAARSPLVVQAGAGKRSYRW